MKTIMKIAVFAQLMLAATIASADHHGEKKPGADIVDTAVAAGQFES